MQLCLIQSFSLWSVQFGKTPSGAKERRTTSASIEKDDSKREMKWRVFLSSLLVSAVVVKGYVQVKEQGIGDPYCTPRVDGNAFGKKENLSVSWATFLKFLIGVSSQRLLACARQTTAESKVIHSASAIAMVSKTEHLIVES